MSMSTISMLLNLLLGFRAGAEEALRRAHKGTDAVRCHMLQVRGLIDGRGLHLVERDDTKVGWCMRRDLCACTGRASGSSRRGQRRWRASWAGGSG
jgi:hypothetical protein